MSTAARVTKPGERNTRRLAMISCRVIEASAGRIKADLRERRDRPRTSERADTLCATEAGLVKRRSPAAGYGPSLPAASSARDPLNMLNIP